MATDTISTNGRRTRWENAGGDWDWWLVGEVDTGGQVEEGSQCQCDFFSRVGVAVGGICLSGFRILRRVLLNKTIHTGRGFIL